jgi:hypothetical protein
MALPKKDVSRLTQGDSEATKNAENYHAAATNFRSISGLKTAALAVAVLAIVCSSRCILAQTGRANLNGNVTDSTGALVAGANVTMTNNATGVATATLTNGSGVYNIIQIVPGSYTVTAGKKGFTTQVQNDFTLVAEQVASLNFSLMPGAETQSITVNAQGQLLNTEDAELGQTINEKSIVELPLNGRNVGQLILLTAGTTDVIADTGAGVHQTYSTFPIESGASANGGRQGSVLYLLDGSYNMDNYHLLAAPFPNPDALQEFTVISNNFDSRYGFSAGGVVSVVTKSGTNAWHGDVFEFLRNGVFNAKDYFTKTSDNLKQNQFGGSIGGPIVKNKLFIFGNYQGTRASSLVSSSNNYVPTTAMRQGDFSAFCVSGFTNGLCNDRNPNSINPSDPFVNHQIWVANAAGESGNTITQSQALANPARYYANNFIDPTTFNPASVKLVNLFPNNTSDQFGHISSIGYVNVHRYDEGTVRADYDLNQHNRISGRMFLDFYNQPPYSNNLLSSRSSWIVDYQNYAGTWTDTINPHVVNTVTGHYSRMFDTSSSGLKVNGHPICFSQFMMINEPTNFPCTILAFAFGGNYQAGGTGVAAGNFNSDNRWSWGASESLSISKGKHLITTGGDVLRQYQFENTDFPAVPIVAFFGGPQGQFTGSSWADFLLGDLSWFYQGGGEPNLVHGWMIAPYVTDQIKVTHNFTMSAGVRWEPWIAPVISKGEIAMYIPGQQSTRYPNAPLGEVFPGDRGVPNAGLPSKYARYVDPRIGFAWQPKFLSNTAIRGAFGVYATPTDYATFTHSIADPPFSPIYSIMTGTIVNGNPIPIVPFQNPWSVYSPTGFKSPFPPFASVNTTPGPSAQFFPPVTISNAYAPNYIDGQTYTWNLSIEHQFSNTWLARAAYVGTTSSHQSVLRDQNYGQFFGAGNPANGTRLNANFGQMLVQHSDGNANYNGAQFTLERRLARGLQLQANYTYSHTIDEESFSTTSFTNGVSNPRCIRCNRGNSYLDVPQNFIMNLIYTTPALQGMNLAARQLLGAWEISGIFNAHSGNPFTIVSGQTTAWDAAGGDYPDYAPGVHSVRTHPGNLTNYIDASNFTLAPQGSKGNVGRNPPGAYLPGVNNWDLALSKNFPIRERYRFQFRWEMYNAFNRPTFAGPNSNLSSGQFGLINQTTDGINGGGPANAPGGYPPRKMQVVAKFYF